MASKGGFLKSKRILTDSHFGTVLNEPERERVIILHAVRVRHAWVNNLDIMSRLAGAASTGSRWVVTDMVVAIPWSKAGIPQVCQKIPRFLFAHRLRYQK